MFSILDFIQSTWKMFRRGEPNKICILSEHYLCHVGRERLDSKSPVQEGDNGLA